MTESTIYTHNKVYSYLTSYLIAAGTTEVVLDLSAAHRASKVCARGTSMYAQVNKFIDSKYGSDYVFEEMSPTQKTAALFCPIVRYCRAP